MGTERSASDIVAGLDPIVRALKADGYDLEVERSDERLGLRIVATEGACKDCLSPPTVLTHLISTALGRIYGPDDIDLSYPDVGG